MKKRSPQKPKKFVEELACKITSSEYETHAEELAKQILAEREQETLRKVVETHTVLRQVECIEEIDFERNRARVMRLDTDEMVRERAITGDERAALAQGELPVDEQPKNGAETKA